jgi:hypothetical protein
LAPLPIGGRPVSIWTGALMASIRLCNGDALAACASVYQAAPAVKARTNWS